MTAINASHDTLNNSKLPAFLDKCDTMGLLKQLCNSQRCPTYVGRTLETELWEKEVGEFFYAIWENGMVGIVLSTNMAAQLYYKCMEIS